VRARETERDNENMREWQRVGEKGRARERERNKRNFCIVASNE